MTSTTSDVVLGSKGFRLSGNARTLGAIIATVVAVAVMAGIWLSRREERAAAASQALFLAQKTFDEEETKLSESLRPATPAVSKNKNDKNPPAPAPAAAPDITFRKLNVEDSFKAGIPALQLVATQHSGTRAGTDAALTVADVYYRHGHWDKAVEWFEKAQRSASDPMDKVSAWAGHAYALENLGKREAAVSSFEKALQVGEESWKGDILLALARNQAALKKTDAAKATYDRILKELPGTDAATAAEGLKGRLGGAAQ